MNINKRKNAFTLIELIAVLVIMAIIALIATPLVMNIIRKARISADKRSVDAYGRSIELAIAGYLLDTGKFPTEVSQLTIEYSGSQVVCSTTQINTDSSVYLADCTVAGRSVDNYTYGEDKTPPAPTYAAYQVGDQVTYNSINYYVIKDSDTTEDSVTLLKAEPLTVAEVNEYGAGHVNRYTSSSVGTAYDSNGYGGMQYYSSGECLHDGYHNGCRSDYETSEIKYVVDAWKNAEAPAASEARLITIDDLTTNLGYEYNEQATSTEYRNTESTPSWVHNSNYSYWTMTPAQDSAHDVLSVTHSATVMGHAYKTADNYDVVRPVITISKSNLSS